MASKDFKNKNHSGFTFYCPTETVFGAGVRKHCAELVGKYGGSRALIVLGEGGSSRRSGLLEQVIAQLEHAGMSCVLHEGVKRNPRLSFVLEGAETAKRESVDFILAIGGGSTIDTAKAIAAFMNFDGDAVDILARKAVPEKLTPMGVICTVAGSGAETSGGCVILDDIRTHGKHSYRYPHNRARFALLDPELTYSVDPYLTASGAVDIFGHGIEGYFNYGTAALGDLFCESVMRIAVQFGPVACADPTDYEARAELMQASSFAHNDVCRIGRSVSTGGVVNLERHLSAAFDTYHGAGVAVVMPAWIECMVDNDPDSLPKLAQLATRVFDVEAPAGDSSSNQVLAEIASEGARRMRSWLDGMRMPRTLTELLGRRPTDEEMEAILGDINFDAADIFKGFSNLTREQVAEMLERIR